MAAKRVAACPEHSWLLSPRFHQVVLLYSSWGSVSVTLASMQYAASLCISVKRVR